MKVILKDDIESLGSFGDIIEVKGGYARNYLIPKGLVWPYDKKSSKAIENLRAEIEKRKEREKELALEKVKEIEAISITIQAEVGEDEKLFGTVTNQDIADKLKEAGIEVSKKDITIEEPIKKLGVFKVNVKVYSEIVASCKVWVVKAGE